jgi:hypothetical protein
MWRFVDLVWSDVSEERIVSIFSLQPPVHAGSSLADFSTLKMEEIRSSETSFHTRSAQHHIPEDGILQENYRLAGNWTPLFDILSIRFIDLVLPAHLSVINRF